MKARGKVWLELDGQYVFGFGLSEILKAVRAAGSIKAAAHRLGKSYRYIWGRIKKAEQALGEPLVETRVGGTGTSQALGEPLVETRVGGTGTSRSSLTERAGRLVADYDALRRRMLNVVQEEFSSRFEPPSGRKRARR